MHMIIDVKYFRVVPHGSARRYAAQEVTRGTYRKKGQGLCNGHRWGGRARLCILNASFGMGYQEREGEGGSTSYATVPGQFPDSSRTVTNWENIGFYLF